jgi:peptidoglycan/LPS O-acetylase OafA/YrhL
MFLRHLGLLDHPTDQDTAGAKTLQLLGILLSSRETPAAGVIYRDCTDNGRSPFVSLRLAPPGVQVPGFWCSTFTGNIALWLQADYFAGAAETKPLLHMWSLAVEAQYYLLLPTILVVVPRRFWLAGVAVLLIVSLGLCVYVAGRDPSAAFYLLPTRFWEMAIGSFGALLPTNALLTPRLSALRVPAVGVLLVIPCQPIGTSHPGFDAALACLATLILLIVPTKHHSAMLPLARIGDISYSLYLVHWPVFVFVKAAWLGAPPALTVCGALSLSLAASWFLYWAIEKPFHQGFFVSRKRLTSGLVAASLALGLAPSVVIAATKSNIDFKQIRRVNLGLGRPCALKRGSPPQEVP